MSAGNASSARRSTIVFAALAAGLLIPYALLWRMRDWNADVLSFLTLYFAAFALYGIAAKLAAGGYFDSVPRSSLPVLACAVFFRLAVLGTDPTLSEDFYRYVWDGRVQATGYGPYDYPPGAEELQYLRDAYHPRINYKEFRTPYPPAAENIFHLLARLSSGILAFKFGLLCFDFLLLEVLRRLLRREGLSPAALLLYAWHPLPIVEFAGSGHMDIIGISLMMLSLLLLECRKPAAGGVALAAAALVKYLPALSLPWMLKKGGWKTALLAGLTVVLLFLQFYTPDLRMLDGVQQYYRKWWYNDSVFSLLRSGLGNAERARRFGMLAVFAVTGWCFWEKLPVYRSLFLIYATVLLFSPVVHPWYVCWILPLLVFHRNPAWLFFAGWISIAYLIRILNPVGIWKEPLWLKLLVYLPLYALILSSAVRSILRKRYFAPQS